VDRVSNGVITTIAKGTISAPDDGVPPSAQLGWWAAGVAVDGAGNVYVADAINNRILVFTPFRNDREPLVRLRQPTANSAPPVQPAR
jgi:DNA-binding beta-propeller fold protein YncE